MSLKIVCSVQAIHFSAHYNKQKFCAGYSHVMWASQNTFFNATNILQSPVLLFIQYISCGIPLFQTSLLFKGVFHHCIFGMTIQTRTPEIFSQP